MAAFRLGFRPTSKSSDQHHLLLTALKPPTPCPFRSTDMAKRPRESDTMQAGPSTLSPQPSSHSGTPATEDDLQRLIPQVGAECRLRPTWLIQQKRYYRQRAHANVFLDHALD
jgi:hypothetical protein